MNLQAHAENDCRAAPTRAPRTLVRAFAISLAAHLLLLWPAQRPNVRPLLSATLRPGAVHPPSEPARPATAPAVQARESARAIPMRDRAAASPTERAPARTRRAEAVAAAPEAAPPAETIDADSLRSYRIALALNARRFRVYPEQAIARRESGTVELRVQMQAGAGAGRVELLRSSGHAALDRQAEQMLSRAIYATVLPEPLRGRSFAFDMPVEYSLPDER